MTLVLNLAAAVRAQCLMFLDLVHELGLATGQLCRRKGIILLEAVLVKNVLAVTLIDVFGPDTHFKGRCTR